MTTWWDGSSTGFAASAIGPRLGREVNGWYDVTDSKFGAKCDLKTCSATMAAGSTLVTAGVGWATSDVGKLVVVRGAGVVLATASDGAMSTATSYNANILTSATSGGMGGGFDRSLLGRRIVVTGGITTINTWVWDVVSATQLRLGVNVNTTATGLTFTVCEDLYTSVLAATNSSDPFTSDGTATLAATASFAVTLANGWSGTDDSAAIQSAILAAFLDAPRDTQASAPTIFIPRSCGITATIELANFSRPDKRTGKIRILGCGLQGFSDLLARGSVTIKALGPNVKTFFRWAPPRSGMGFRGSITAGTKILTDPDAKFLTTAAVGNTIGIIGSGTQAGSQTQVAQANTTIQSVDSDTQLTVNTNAITTVTEGVYSWANNNGTPSLAATYAHGGSDSFSLERLHIMGNAGQICGVHAIGASTYELKGVTISDFRSGVGHYADGMVNNATMMNIENCRFNDSYGGVLAAGNPGGTVAFAGMTYMDGNSNLVGVLPGEGTFGIKCASCYVPNTLVIQSYYTGVYSESRAFVRALRLEAIQRGVVLAGDNGAALAGDGHDVKCTSFSTSNVAGSVGRGLVLLSGVRRTLWSPGFYVPSNIGMYTDCDATSLSTCLTDDANLNGRQAPAFAASYTPDIAKGTTISITLTGNITINAPTNVLLIPRLRFILTQDGTGGRTVTWNAIFKTNWTPTTTASKINSIEFAYDGTNWIQVSSTVGM